jgi:hypothetical protein
MKALILALALFSIGQKAFTQTLKVSDVCWSPDEGIYWLQLEAQGLKQGDTVAWSIGTEDLTQITVYNGTSLFHVPQDMGVVNSIGVYVNGYYKASVVTNTELCHMGPKVKEFRIANIKRIR